MVILKPEPVKNLYFGPGTKVKETLSISDQLSMNPTNPQAEKPMNSWTQTPANLWGCSNWGIEILLIPTLKISLEKLQP